MLRNTLGRIRKAEISREEIAVTVSGIVSMGLEILAGRVLAPEFGSTIYTWGSIIGVFMLALSLGYHFGGKKAHKIGLEHLETLLVYTSIYTLLLIFLGDRLITVFSQLPISPKYGAILPLAVLFGPPTYFLGYISPYAAQLSSKDTKGEASGHFYAIGTAGSILGAFGTTFLLVPYLQVDHIYLFFSAVALLPVLRPSLREPRNYYLLVVLAIGLLMSSAAPVSGSTVYQESTPYQELRVADDDGVRTLYLDEQPQSATYINGTDGYPWDYLDYFHMPFLMRDDVDRVLFIGGGGFTGPQEFEEKNITVDAVELDPDVVETAKEYFNLSESENLNVHVMDGREYLEQTDKEYDVIYVDAYRKAQVPFHLTTRQFMELAHQKTDEDGVVVSNVISASSGPGSRFARSQYRTMGKVFNSTYFYPTRNTSFAQNIELVASKGPDRSESYLREQNRNYSGKNLSEEIGKRIDPETEDVPILRDDYAPVDRLLDPLVGRKYVVD
jgi:spermidine synthase